MLTINSLLEREWERLVVSAWIRSIVLCTSTCFIIAMTTTIGLYPVPGLRVVRSPADVKILSGICLSLGFLGSFFVDIPSTKTSWKAAIEMHVRLAICCFVCGLVVSLQYATRDDWRSLFY